MSDNACQQLVRKWELILEAAFVFDFACTTNRQLEQFFTQLTFG